MKTATAETKLTSPRILSLQSALNCARLAAENKARDVVVLDLTDVTPIYDYFVIATGSSRRQILTPKKSTQPWRLKVTNAWASGL